MKKSKVSFYLFLTVVVAILVKAWEPGLGLSSTTYGAFAQNILRGQSLFHFNLSPGIFDPFIDHPPLIIWIQSFFFYLFGISAQVLRFPSMLLGLGVFMSMFFVARKVAGEVAGVGAVLSLLLINTFMNFTNSGWLDMGMVGFMWMGFACLYLHVDYKGWKSYTLQVLGCLLLGAALLSKGLAAMGLLPIVIFFLFRNNWKKTILWGVFAAAPVALFTWMFFRENGHIFWITYWNQRAINAAQMAVVYGVDTDLLWYFKKLIGQSHIVVIAAAVGIYISFKNRSANDKSSKELFLLALLILSEVLLHGLVYGQTNREYGQYLLPAFPWIALAGGIGFNRIFAKAEALKVSKGMFFFVVFFFILTSILPVVVHNGEDNEYRQMAAFVKPLKSVKKVRILADFSIQHSWEGEASYVAWYWDLPAVLKEKESLFVGVGQDEAVAIYADKQPSFDQAIKNSNLVLCIKSKYLYLYTKSDSCPINEVVSEVLANQSSATKYSR